MTTEFTRYALARRLVDAEICYCVSSLVADLLKRVGERDSLIDEDDALALSEAAPDADDYREAAAYDDDGKRLTVTADADADGAFWRWSNVDEDGVVIDGGEEETEIEAWRAAFESASIDTPDGREVYEHWLVTDWLARRLREAGESVATDVAGLTIWGRTTTGQAIAMDSVIQRIALDAYGEADPRQAADERDAPEALRIVRLLAKLGASDASPLLEEMGTLQDLVEAAAALVERRD